MTTDGGGWRLPTAKERALLAEITAGEWPGAAELRSQLPGARVRPGCPCGCGTLELTSSSGVREALTRRLAPREGVILDHTGGEVGGLILFLADGRLASLEVYSFGEDPAPALPGPGRVRWETQDGA